MRNVFHKRQRRQRDQRVAQQVRLAEWLEPRLLFSETATAQVTLTSTTGSLPNATYNYTVSVTDTGTTAIGTFWFGWVPGENLLTSIPTPTGSPAGWTATVTGAHNSSDGSAIEWVSGSSASNIMPTQTISTFTFSTTDTPATLAANSPTHTAMSSSTATIYSGAPFSDGGFQLTAGAASLTTPTVSVNSPTPTSVEGSTVTFVATVAPPGNSQSPSGMVNFDDNGQFLGSATIQSGGMASLTAGSLPLGVDTITASYGGDAFYNGASSGPFDETITMPAATPTTTSLSTSNNVIEQGGSAILTATVTGTGASQPTGTVTFNDDSGSIGSAQLEGDTATIQISSLPTSPDTITAVYGGDSSNDLSTSNSIMMSVASPTLAASTTSLNAPTSMINAGTSVTFTATVMPQSGAGSVPTGSVNFYSGSTLLGNAALQNGSTTFSTSGLPAGLDDVTADYQGDSNYAPSTSPVFAEMVTGSGTQSTPTVTLATTSSIADVGQSLTFTATIAGAISSSPTPTGMVTFVQDSTTLGTVAVANGVATYSTSSLGAGTYSIFANYSGDSNYLANTATISQQVIVPGTSATTTTLSSDVPVGTPGGSIVFTATVLPVNMSGAAPTGVVDFTVDGTPAGYAPLQGNGLATLEDSALTVGSHQVVATYIGDSTYAVSSSAPLTQIVEAPEPTTGFIPTITKSTVPTALVQSGHVRGGVVVTATDQTSATLSGKVAVKLYASTDGIVDQNSILLGQVIRRVRLKAGKAINVPFPLKAIFAKEPAGNYVLLAQAVDPSANTITARKGPSVNLATPFISLSESLARVTLPSSVTAGQKTTAVVMLNIANAGNVVTPGKTSASVYLSKNGLADSDSILIRSVIVPIRVQAGKSSRLAIPLKQIPANATSGNYYVVVQLIDGYQHKTSVATTTKFTVG